jgi:hypothetical protein
MSWKPWIGVDLDGTLAKHYWPDDGPYHPLRIGDPIHRMVERVKLWIAEDKEVRIFTARVAPLGSSPGFNDEQQLPLIHATIAMWTQQHIGVALAATCMKTTA